MTYGLFNLDSGNLVEAVPTEEQAFALVAQLMESEPECADHLALVVEDDEGETVATYVGQELAALTEDSILH